MYKSPIRIQRRFILTFIVVLCISFISGVVFSEPLWLSKPGIYINHANNFDSSFDSFDNFYEFDSKVKYSGCPAWGSGWCNSPGCSSNGGKPIIDLYHSKGRVYVGFFPFFLTNIGDINFIDQQEMAAINLEGNGYSTSEFFYTNINSPKRISHLKELMQTIIDDGADGVHFDDTGINLEYCFDKYTLALFTNHLKNKYSDVQLSEKFNIKNIESFNYKDWIISTGQKVIWPFTVEGLGYEFWLFRVQNVRIVFSELKNHIKNYANVNYQKEITVSANASIGNDLFDVYADLVDYHVGEANLFSLKVSHELSLHPVEYIKTDFQSINNKISWSFQKKPNFPLIELAGVDVLEYPDHTKNLIKLIMADTLSTQALPLLMSGFDGVTSSGELVIDVSSYDYDEIIPYAEFVYQYPELFSTNIYYQPNCALLYSRSSHLPKALTNYPPPPLSFFGIGQFLIDKSIPFDVIYAPDTRLNDLPDITLSKLSYSVKIWLDYRKKLFKGHNVAPGFLLRQQSVSASDPI